MQPRSEIYANGWLAAWRVPRCSSMHPLARLLLIEPYDLARSMLEAAASSFAQVESHGDFETARARLHLVPFDFLVTNVRLDAHNGLHLVYLSASGRDAPRAIVYSDEHDPGLAREVQRTGAFYEMASCLPVTLAAYLTARLPVGDRRDSAISDRRTRSRGGRRRWDTYLSAHLGTAG